MFHSNMDCPEVIYSSNNNRDDLSFLSILKNNLLVVTLLLSGTLLLGSTTLVNLMNSGITVARLIILANACNLSLHKFLLLVLPHGIFEIPAIIIAGAAGFKIPYEIIRYLAGRKEQILTKEDIKEYFTLALISIILIVIAAFVEAYVTPRVANTFYRGKLLFSSGLSYTLDN
ncbi:protein of unknown function DUF95 transmembrane [Ferroglobus placidus DSM 10642]|uniref:Stage II sporulation protein M n=2 Tax=Ferroglobus placidus TaxID=54261 RepID=D3S2K5_FERPA|nr:protein of unknown function DUF95 transmembrane [Ferroglobus placidus DSM 10642]